MLHSLHDTGHMGWTCPHCASERTAHVSHEQVEHPSHDEVESVQEGTFTDEQGRTWTRSISRPTGNKIVDASMIALPACECGTRTFLKATFTDEEYAGIARHDAEGKETTASVDAAQRHMAVADHLKRLGKGPDDIRKGKT